MMEMEKFKINDNVKIINSSIYGKIIALKKNLVTFKTLDGKIISCDKENLKKCDIKSEKSSKVTLNIKIEPNKEFKNEIMLRHLNKEEAIITLEKFISDAIVNKEKKIKIIHGKHGGILREAVHEYLNNSKYVEKYELARIF